MASTSSRKHDFTYEIAASFCGKQNKFDPASDYYTFPSTSHRILLAGQTPWTPASGRFESGQDALYTSVLGDKGLSFGLADGVGGWADQGIDPSDFSHGLCNRMAEASEAFGRNRTNATEGQSLPKDLPRRILQEAFDGISDDDSVQGGGSTACVGVVDWAGKMTAANLGDSGFAHFRLAASPPTVVHVSPHQTHAFNTPFQLSQTPPSLRRKMELFGRSAPQGDQPKHSAISQHQLQHGDVVMFATDGVWDNLSEEEIVAIIAQQCEDAGIWQDSKGLSNKQLALSTSESTDAARNQHGKNLQVAIATAVVNAAKKAGLDEKRDGPFAKEVQKRYPYEEFHGGKHDDVCVIVLVALETSKMAQAKL